MRDCRKAFNWISIVPGYYGAAVIISVLFFALKWICCMENTHRRAGSCGRRVCKWMQAELANQPGLHRLVTFSSFVAYKNRLQPAMRGQHWAERWQAINVVMHLGWRFDITVREMAINREITSIFFFIKIPGARGSSSVLQDSHIWVCLYVHLHHHSIT